MIDVYAFATPNSVRVPIALEELGLPYVLTAINVRKGEQKQPGYLAINPNGKVPVLVDSDGPGGKPLTLGESGAILVYLAEKTGKLLPMHGEARFRVLEQMFFHLTGIGPAMGQAGYFQKQAPEPQPAGVSAVFPLPSFLKSAGGRMCRSKRFLSCGRIGLGFLRRDDGRNGAVIAGLLNAL
jgi:GST-like protein